jgi:hypothetical protein
MLACNRIGFVSLDGSSDISFEVSCQQCNLSRTTGLKPGLAGRKAGWQKGACVECPGLYSMFADLASMQLPIAQYYYWYN